MVTTITALRVPKPEYPRRASARRARFAASLLALAALSILPVIAPVSTPASAQGYTFNPRPPRPPAPPRNTANDGQMLVQAAEMNYDTVHSLVSAVGNVQIYYNGTTLEADKVVYNQKTKRIFAEGNVRITDANGGVTHANQLDLSDDFRDGFVDSLRVDTADDTRMAANRADRTGGNFTVFQNGVYTACAACAQNPKKPPLWQVKAARITHDAGEKMLYFEDARFEFMGVPLAYLPYFYAPDPTVKRKSGFLLPSMISSSKFGYGVQVPYYWAIAPDKDLTFAPRVTTRQGVLLQGEYRQRLIDGAYQIRAYGIRQEDKDYFLRSSGNPATPGYRDFRGGVEASGQFAINDKWTWGFDGTLLSDRTFFQDYGLSAFSSPQNIFQNAATEAVSQLYLTGVGQRSYFDARTIYYYGFSEADRQREIPIIHPVIDYQNVWKSPIFGGELSYKTNFTSLSRDQASFDAITTTALNNGWCLPTSADPMARTPSQCLLRGIPGTYTRLSGQVDWRRSIIDPWGQIWTPFASMRVDLASATIWNQPGVTNYLPSGTHELARIMPTVGLEYRYPFISVQPWGTQTIEPIAQVIVRPNERYAGMMPNEDAQSLTFTDSNLFQVNKFSGWDRVEGGGRANVGVRATTQFNQGGTITATFGQSYQLFGQNSYALADLSNTGNNSGLETTRSDYVGGVSFQPNRTFTFSARTRLDETTLAAKRVELETKANFDRWSVSLLYGNYDRQPELGYLNRREGLLSTASVKATSNWVVSGGVRYDLDQHRVNQTIIGAGYVDDCFIIAMNYITDYAYSGNPVADRRIMLQIGLRTLGVTSTTQNVGQASIQP